VATATYDLANRQLAFGDTHTTLDANGNATSISGPGGVTGLTWDARNRLIAVASPSAAAEYVYDAFGRRITKRVGGVATAYLYDGPDIIQELAIGGTVSYLHSDSIDELLTIERPEGRFFPAANALGSIFLLTSEAGATTARYLYEPFGTTTSTNPAFPNAFRFTARELDETGLYYYRARYYSAALHWFLSEDPLGLSGLDSNFYAYVGNNPVMYSDPSGLLGPQIIATLGGALIGGGVAALTGQSIVAGMVTGAATGLAASLGGPIVAGLAAADRSGTSNTLVQRLVIRWATAERARLLVDPSGARTALRDHCMPGESVGEAIRMERE
jgi:RHS repeat-associated protein